jgi:Ca2+-binding EF-hand superfamily protein
MKRSLTLLALACALTGLHALPAAAAEANGTRGDLKKADRNGDGRITREEARGLPRLEKNFDRIDTNNDGALTQDELAAARKRAAEQKKAGAPAS